MERLKRKRKNKNQDIIENIVKTSILKIVVFSIIVGLNWVGILSVGQTWAYLNDVENSDANIFDVASLDFSISSSNDFNPLSLGESNELVRDVKIVDEGSLDFAYKIRVGKSSGRLCNKLKITANLEGGDVECPISDLNDFNCGSFEITGSIDDWKFIVFPDKGFQILPNSCDFELIFEAYQSELDFDSGFSDTEKIDNTITKHHSDTPDTGIVINEFLPNPSAGYAHGEWVELYNKSDIDVDVDGWKLCRGINLLRCKLNESRKKPVKITSSNTFSGSTIVPAKGFLVVNVNEHYVSWMGNSADTLNLWKTNYRQIDDYTYIGYVPEDKTYARIPDGSANWYDPIPTPGAPNQLSEQEMIELGLLDEKPLTNKELIEIKPQAIDEEPVDEEELIEIKSKLIPSVEEVIEESVIIKEKVIEEVAEEIIEEVVEPVVDEIVEEIIAVIEEPAIIPNDDIIIEDNANNKSKIDDE